LAEVTVFGVYATVVIATILVQLFRYLKGRVFFPFFSVRGSRDFYATIIIFVLAWSLFKAFFFIGPTAIIQQISTSDWTPTEAVVDSVIEDSETTCINGSCYTSSWSVVTYSYSIDNESYTSDRYSFITRAPPSSYQNGTEIEVYVDPEDHAESLILRGYDDPRLDGLVTPITRWLTIPPLLFIAIRIGYKLQPETERKKADVWFSENQLVFKGWRKGYFVFHMSVPSLDNPDIEVFSDASVKNWHQLLDPYRDCIYRSTLYIGPPDSTWTVTMTMDDPNRPDYGSFSARNDPDTLFILEEKRDGITVRETKLRIEADTIPMIDFLKKTFGKIDDPSEIWEFHR